MMSPQTMYDFDLFNTSRHNFHQDNIKICKSVAGRLFTMEKFLQTKDFTLDLVKNGYKLLTSNMPYSCFSNNNNSTLKLMQLVSC